MKHIFKPVLKVVWDAFVSARPWSFTMSLISVSIGALLAFEDGPFHWGWFALTCIGIVFFHGAANVLNDYFDTRNGVDQLDSPTALYRRQPILSGLFTPRQTLFHGIFLCILTVLMGLILGIRAVYSGALDRSGRAPCLCFLHGGPGQVEVPGVG